MERSPQQWLRAARSGQWSVILTAIAGGKRVDLNAQDGQGMSALLYAIGAQRVDVVRDLVQAGADVTLGRPPHGLTPLMAVATQIPQDNAEDSLLAMAQLLMAAGAPVDQGNTDGTTALMGAVYRGNRAMVAYLLGAGADANIQDQDGATALGLALEKGDRQMVKTLLEAGARWDIPNGWGELPLTQAVRQGEVAGDLFDRLRQAGAPLDLQTWLTAVDENRVEIIQEFIKAGWPVDTTDDQGDTALHLACLAGHTSLVADLLTHHPPLNIANQAGDTPLQLAIAQGQTAIVHQLLQAGADPRFTVTAESPFLTALTTPDLSPTVQTAIVEALLAAGFPVNQPLNQGQTPLMVAAVLNLPEIIACLAHHGADPNVTDLSGATALMWACHRGQEKAVQALLAHFPDLDLSIKNRGGLTALGLAQMNPFPTVVDLLKTADQSRNH